MARKLIDMELLEALNDFFANVRPEALRCHLRSKEKQQEWINAFEKKLVKQKQGAVAKMLRTLEECLLFPAMLDNFSAIRNYILEDFKTCDVRQARRAVQALQCMVIDDCKVASISSVFSTARPLLDKAKTKQLQDTIAVEVEQANLGKKGRITITENGSGLVFRQCQRRDKSISHPVGERHHKIISHKGGDSALASTIRQVLGRRVCRRFMAGDFVGRVRALSYIPQNRRKPLRLQYQIHYEDGDSEDITYNELLEARAKFLDSRSSDGKSSAGTSDFEECEPELDRLRSRGLKDRRQGEEDGWEGWEEEARGRRVSGLSSGLRVLLAKGGKYKREVKELLREHGIVLPPTPALPLPLSLSPSPPLSLSPSSSLPLPLSLTLSPSLPLARSFARSWCLSCASISCARSRPCSWADAISGPQATVPKLKQYLRALSPPKCSALDHELLELVNSSHFARGAWRSGAPVQR